MYHSDEKNDTQKIEKQSQKQEKTPCNNENIFAMDEIQIEELAIDGICGVY